MLSQAFRINPNSKQGVRTSMVYTPSTQAPVLPHSPFLVLSTFLNAYPMPQAGWAKSSRLNRL